MEMVPFTLLTRHRKRCVCVCERSPLDGAGQRKSDSSLELRFCGQLLAERLASEPRSQKSPVGEQKTPQELGRVSQYWTGQIRSRRRGLKWRQRKASAFRSRLIPFPLVFHPPRAPKQLERILHFSWQEITTGHLLKLWESWPSVCLLDLFL